MVKYCNRNRRSDYLEGNEYKIEFITFWEECI